MEAELHVLDCKISHLNKIVEDTFTEHCSTRLFSLKFQLLDHILENLRILARSLF